MGQRNMTYVITEGGYSGKTINAIYNQWNFVKLQAFKLERVIKLFKSLQRTENIFQTFFASHGLSPTAGWVGGYVCNDEYKEYNMQPFEEDNNNGWVIIKIVEKEKPALEREFKIELCCIWGSEDDVNDKTTYEPVPTAQYFAIEEKNLQGKPEQLKEYQETVKYIVKNTKYNPKLKTEAVAMIEKQFCQKQPA